ncbi:MAG: thrombospondin type 3 repeat-containing protein [Halioglobus sp.]|nr:thrombospondin type 3 repeat-containing protein [Halioglobus sp.]
MNISRRLAEALRAPVLALALLAATSCTTAVAPDTGLASRQPALPRVGMWLHPDIELDAWMCGFETAEENPTTYVHTEIKPTSWREVAAHSSVITLNNFIFAQPQPWTVFENTLDYADYIAVFESFPADSPEGRWYRQLNDHVRTPLAEFARQDDPTSRKLIYIYAHLFGYDPEYARSLGLHPLRPYTYAWPPQQLQGGWPQAFLIEEGNGAGRPSFKMPATRSAMGNAAYFYLKHFEQIGAEVHLSPWREINGYFSADKCPAEANGQCGLDSWEDLYDTYEAMVERVGSGQFDNANIAVYPTLQLESFIGADTRCVNASVVEQIKQFHTRNTASGVPFAIGLSTYPSVAADGLATYQSRLDHLLDSLDSDTPVTCDADGDGVLAPGEGIDPAVPAIHTTLPRATPLTIGETSRPPWLTFQSPDRDAVRDDESFGASMALTHLGYRYLATDGSPAYPLQFVAFALGPNWALPANMHGLKTVWISTASGIARHWLTPMQPLAGQLILDVAMDPDGDWDNDGVPNIKLGDTPVTALNIAGQYLIRAPSGAAGEKAADTIPASELDYTLDNCPYQPNPAQEDADQDGIGDACDNCLNVANYGQADWDQDGFGSACDPDLDNDGRIQEQIDLAIVEQCQGAAIDCLAHVSFPDIPAGQSTPNLNGKVVLIDDMDADADVDEDDINAWHTLAANPRLRESGFTCAGTAPCPDPSSVMLRNGQTVTVNSPPPKRRVCGNLGSE